MSVKQARSAKQTSRGRKMAASRPGTTPKVGQKVTLKPSSSGQKKITYKKGGLHASLGVPQGQKIPPAKLSAALSGKYGAKAKKQAQFMQNVLVGRH